MEWKRLDGDPDLSLLDQIPWIELDHAYGSAIDVPEQIRGLLSPDSERRRNTIFSFTCNIYHQGSVYSSTVAAIQVFQHLLQYPRTPDRSRILELLAAFAVFETGQDNVELATVLETPDTESDCGESWNRECYLAIGAGLPLYELLLDEEDPCVAISAAFLMSHFPAHAFESCRRLLKIAETATTNDFLRSAALIAISFLGGGPVTVEFRNLLESLVRDESAQADVPLRLLAAAAVYCVLRDRSIPSELKEIGLRLADRSLQFGIEVPQPSIYPISRTPMSADISTVVPLDLFVPPLEFPWGDLNQRLKRYSKVRRSTTPVPRSVDSGPHPDSFHVIPGQFDRDNVVAAVRRLHAHFRRRSKSGIPLAPFEPFKPHAMLAWDVILQLLDSEKNEDRWAAAAVLDQFPPLDESAVDQLIERLYHGNSGLGGVISKHPITERQCERFCEQLCRREFAESKVNSPRDEIRRLVLQHGTVAQVRRLFDEGDLPERQAAAMALCSREAIEPAEALPVIAQALVTGGMSEKLFFAKWPEAHAWYLKSLDAMPVEQCWAIANTMVNWKADLTEFQEDLFRRVESPLRPILTALLIDCLRNLPESTPQMVDRLLAVCHADSHAAVRCAVVRALGGWIDRGFDNLLYERLQPFINDASARVRREAMNELPRFVDHRPQTVELLRQLLRDNDEANRRAVLWKLSDLGELTAADVLQLTTSDPSDRVSAEALLAAFVARPPMVDDKWLPTGESRPLTRSVAEWISNSRSQTTDDSPGGGRV
ncbi:MAG: HEAT repeat domain-containing protein [Planctomycetes bacterium]|nr:HEAT repeat domain-containing protein [Planctomycetota bacterium]